MLFGDKGVALGWAPGSQGWCNYTLRQRLLLPNLLVFSVAVVWDGSSVSGDLVSLVFSREMLQAVSGRKGEVAVLCCSCGASSSLGPQLQL